MCSLFKWEQVRKNGQVWSVTPTIEKKYSVFLFPNDWNTNAWKMNERNFQDSLAFSLFLFSSNKFWECNYSSSPSHLYFSSIGISLRLTLLTCSIITLELEINKGVLSATSAKQVLFCPFQYSFVFFQNYELCVNVAFRCRYCLLGRLSFLVDPEIIYLLELSSTCNWYN